MFAELPYAVLGLGDTNYDKFCHMGKVIDKRLSELGGKQLLPLFCADEATNLEEIVESWKTQVLEAIVRSINGSEQNESSSNVELTSPEEVLNH